ncbi:biotin-dependent carboxyltransferase family protein [Puniceibacterium sediminis]|uniref:Allophanate hydrolase n=1 Tax=Puniceibacterium sediminis TaxID=1608407 RepID=A0A238X019_9RHOB|nr:biotin-dependent carboxyltransferase family protein [Puniceibacterium sediminis]SNR52177.1 allophanate hydrolase [Puniceibacterium sediminis]
MSLLTVHRAGPGITVQDMGRSGTLAFGLSRGGAMDRLALAEGAALLGQGADLAVLEMAGTGGRFEVDRDTRIALTGAPMRVTLDGANLTWGASHLLPKGAILDIGPVTAGAYGYLHVGGGIDVPQVLGARSTHLAAGLGKPVAAGDRLPLGTDVGGDTGLHLPQADRFNGGTVRVVPSLQTELFPQDQRDRFAKTRFKRDTRANRMGVRLDSQGEGFSVSGGLSVVSEMIVPGDIQVTGDGAPFVLMAESQTTGGYPRIGTVLPCDLPRVAQAPAGATLEFRFVTMADALEAERRFRAEIKGLPRQIKPLVRDPHDIRDLLSYQLISGVTAGGDI